MIYTFAYKAEKQRTSNDDLMKFAVNHFGVREDEVEITVEDVVDAYIYYFTIMENDDNGKTGTRKNQRKGNNRRNSRGSDRARGRNI